MKRLCTAIALFSVGTELRAGKNVNTTADRRIHHCTDTRNAISDFRNFYGVAIESVYTGYENPISGRHTRYIDTYKLNDADVNLIKMDAVLHGLAMEIEELKAAYALKKEKSKKFA
jgi:hypothetical protein